METRGGVRTLVKKYVDFDESCISSNSYNLEIELELCEVLVVELVKLRIQKNFLKSIEFIVSKF